MDNRYLENYIAVDESCPDECSEMKESYPEDLLEVDDKCPEA